ncbi:ABC transporter ATP-binding protein [Clostridium sp. 'deep sea']|uniref:ABC transporter ATP-binding protein n=1 Tax=Clostridium sp. 'deep sea' TaxID=2779445 RepID=UPI0018969FE9|nr:ABC transporter ATP-binding protein [Clostridium sp. 'deep sea']QOR36922.1 ABC transporter ATP-binding protein [Clostridium sp. 'deep sea']
MNRKLKKSIVIIVFEGLLGGCNFIVLHQVLQLVFGNGVTLNKLMTLTGIVALILTLRIILYSFGFIGSQIGGADVSRNIRIALGDKLKNIPLGLFTKRHTGFYINVATSGVSNYEKMLTHKTADIIKYIVLVIMVALFACTIYLPVGITLMISSILLIPTIIFTARIVKFYGNKKNSANSESISSIAEYISGIQTLRAYGMSGKKNKTVTDAMKDYSNISYLYERSVIPIGSIYMTLNWLAFPVSVFLAGDMWVNNALPVPDLILLLMFPLFICKINIALFIDLLAYKDLTISKNNITKIINEQEENISNEEFTPKSTEIEFNNVDFSYIEGEPVLQNTSFIIPEHSLTAIVGDSGSGKSTILNLISKYYLPQKGCIKIGGYDIEKVPSEKVFSYISTVDQDVFLFNDTIRNNIRYARPSATNEEVEHACCLANCDSFICKMKNGYDTETGENGNQLSGGERQRISVARAILKNSPIVLLDEATASLDIENELLVKQAVTNLLNADRTVIMIAHTLSIVKNADKILVLDEGRIAESGNHRELINLGGKYAAMWKASKMLI